MGRRRLHLLMLAIAMLGAAAANAIELQVVDQHQDRQSSPASGPETCRASLLNKFEPNFTSTSASLLAQTAALASGTDCDAAVATTAQGSVTLTVIGPVGATGSVCYVSGFAARTTAEGANATPGQDIGGDPYSTPGGVFLNGNPLASFRRHFGPNDGDAQTLRGLVTVTVGDMIRLAAGSNSQMAIQGAGTLRAEGQMSAAIYIGDCPRERAPVASPLGLGGLAVALAALGALGVRRWRARDAR